MLATTICPMLAEMVSLSLHDTACIILTFCAEQGACPPELSAKPVHSC